MAVAYESFIFNSKQPQNRPYEESLLFLIYLILFTNCLYSQDTISWTPEKVDADYAKRYDKLKDLYIKHLDSESYRHYKALHDDFFAALGDNNTVANEIATMKLSTVESEDPIMEWVARNIAKTDFKNLEEAKAAYEKVNEAYFPMVEENQEYFDYLKELLKYDDGKKILTDVVVELITLYPDKF